MRTRKIKKKDSNHRRSGSKKIRMVMMMMMMMVMMMSGNKFEAERQNKSSGSFLFSEKVKWIKRVEK